MFTSTKKKLIIAGLASSVVFVGAGMGGWALVNYYKENFQTPLQQLDEAVQKKISPIIDPKLTNFSSEWMVNYSTNSDFDFTNAEGYNNNLRYDVVQKEAIDRKLKITVKVSINNIESSNYDLILNEQFATQDVSARSVVEQTNRNLPLYNENISVSNIPEENMSIAPESIVINSSDFTRDISGNFIYRFNGAHLKPSKVLDLYSTEAEINDFVREYITLSNTTIPEANIINDIKQNIREQKTVILFSVNDDLKIVESAAIVVRDLSNFYSSNFIENASELSLELNNLEAIAPSAREIIDSIRNNNPEKYLDFVGLTPSSNFIYKIHDVSTIEDDIKEESLEFTILITQRLNQATRTYKTTLSGLTSIQQAHLNNIVANTPYSQWAINPRISSAYSNKTISEIINSPNLEAFEFASSDLQRYPDYNYVVSYPTEIQLGGKSAISVYVEMVSKVNPDAMVGYYFNITSGFKP
ncbi:MAG: hypothetical protein ACRC1F_02235 [Metamycoplasmataceae bacterium]